MRAHLQMQRAQAARGSGLAPRLLHGRLRRARPRPRLITRYWSPGWNSVQALNQFQEEIGGAAARRRPRCSPDRAATVGRAVAYFARASRRASRRDPASGWSCRSTTSSAPRTEPRDAGDRGAGAASPTSRWARTTADATGRRAGRHAGRSSGRRGRSSCRCGSEAGLPRGVRRHARAACPVSRRLPRRPLGEARRRLP